ncbi:MAG: hypothetical protein PUE12_02890 [Oscillospiraceae bacterium]|nr:hypothetical protein [Oscillospiraceae bacterium]
MDVQSIQSFSEKVISTPVLIALLYAVSLGWLISFLYSRKKYKNLLSKCNDLQENNVRLEKLNENLNLTTAQLNEDLKIMKGDE